MDKKISDRKEFERKALLIFSVSLQIAGYAFLIWADWRTALGVFLIHWSINIEIGKKAKEK